MGEGSSAWYEGVLHRILQEVLQTRCVQVREGGQTTREVRGTLLCTENTSKPTVVSVLQLEPTEREPGHKV